MNRKAVSQVALFIVAGAVSACNSTDTLYRQGPWGPASTPRSYPEYSAPWGRPPVLPAYGAVVQPVYDPIHVVEAPLHPARKSYEVHLEPELPPGFPPGSSPAVDVGSRLEPLPAPGPAQASSRRLSVRHPMLARGKPALAPHHAASSSRASRLSISTRPPLRAAPATL
jgi:hypothetical protein